MLEESLHCVDPDGCAHWAAERTQSMRQRLPRADQLHELFLRQLTQQPPAATWLFNIHGVERQALRAVGRADVEDVLLCGSPIEAAFSPQGGTVLLAGETGNGRPLHLACQFFLPPRSPVWEWTVATVYDPRTEPWRWSADHTQRICRCHPHSRSARQE